MKSKVMLSVVSRPEQACVTVVAAAPEPIAEVPSATVPEQTVSEMVPVVVGKVSVGVPAVAGATMVASPDVEPATPNDDSTSFCPGRPQMVPTTHAEEYGCMLRAISKTSFVESVPEGINSSIGPKKVVAEVEST